MQLIFVVEASRESKSDYYYIFETLKEYYNILGHKFTPIFMNGKGNYDKKQTEINRNILKYQGQSKVFICYDIDDPSKPAYALNSNIKVYAKNNNYEIIWFYEDVEQAYIKQSVMPSIKIKRAKQFVAHDEIKKS